MLEPSIKQLPAGPRLKHLELDGPRQSIMMSRKLKFFITTNPMPHSLRNMQALLLRRNSILMLIGLHKNALFQSHWRRPLSILPAQDWGIRHQ